MPWLPLPSFHRIDEDAFREAARKSKSSHRIDERHFQEAIWKTKSIRRTGKRDDLRNERGGGKGPEGKVANKGGAQDVDARKNDPLRQAQEKRAPKTFAGDKQTRELYEKMQLRDMPQRGTQKRDVRSPREKQAGRLPLRQTRVDASNRRRPGGPSPVIDLGNIADDQEDEHIFDDQPRHGLRSSRLPNRRNLPEPGPRDDHGFNLRPHEESSRAPGPYDKGAGSEEEDDSGYQSQSGTRSSQGLALTENDEEDPEEDLLRHRRLNLLGSLEHPPPRKSELGEPDMRHVHFTRLDDERRHHVPGSFVTDDSDEDEEIFDSQTHHGPRSSPRPSPFHYGEDDPEAHDARLRRLESLRNSYSPPVDQNRGSLDTRYPAQRESKREIPYRYVNAHELDGRGIDQRDLDERRTDERGIRTHHVSNRRGGLDPHNYGNDLRDDNDFAYRPRGETRIFPQNAEAYENQRTQTSRRPAPDVQPARAQPRRHSMQYRQQEPSRPTHDIPHRSYSQQISLSRRPNDSRRPVPQPQPDKAQPRPQQEPHRDRSSRPYSQSVFQTQRPNDSRRPVSTSRSTIAQPRSRSKTPRQEGPPRRTRDGPSHPDGQRTNRYQRRDNSRRPVPQSQPVRTHQTPHRTQSHREEPPRRSHRNDPPPSYYS